MFRNPSIKTPEISHDADDVDDEWMIKYEYEVTQNYGDATQLDVNPKQCVK